MELTLACNTNKQDAKKLKDAVTALCARHGGGVGGEDGEEREDTEKSEVVNKTFLKGKLIFFSKVVRQKEFLEKTVVTLKNQLNQVEFYISEANHFYHHPSTWQTDSN